MPGSACRSAPTAQLLPQLWLQGLLLDTAFTASVCTCLMSCGVLTATLCLVQADRVHTGLRDEFIVQRVLGMPEDIRRLCLAGVVAVKNRDTLNPQTLEQAQASETAFFRDQVIANLLPERQAMRQLTESRVTVPQLIR